MKETVAVIADEKWSDEQIAKQIAYNIGDYCVPFGSNKRDVKITITVESHLTNHSSGQQKDAAT